MFEAGMREFVTETGVLRIPGEGGEWHVAEMGRREFFGLCALRLVQVGAGAALVGVLAPPVHAAATVLVCAPGAKNTCGGVNTCSTALGKNTCAPNVCNGKNECLGAGTNSCTTGGGMTNTCVVGGGGAGSNLCDGSQPGNECIGTVSGQTGNTCGGATGGTNLCDGHLSSNTCQSTNNVGNECLTRNDCYGAVNGTTNTCNPGASHSCKAPALDKVLRWWGPLPT